MSATPVTTTTSATMRCGATTTGMNGMTSRIKACPTWCTHAMYGWMAIRRSVKLASFATHILFMCHMLSGRFDMVFMHHAYLASRRAIPDATGPVKARMD